MGSSGSDLSRDRIRAMAELQSGPERRRVSDDQAGSRMPALDGGLTQEVINDRLRVVIESVGSCRERHLNRGEPLDENRGEVRFVVYPTGDITSFQLLPASLNDTLFGRCMNSHTGRWRFPRYQGDEVEIRMPFALE